MKPNVNIDLYYKIRAERKKVGLDVVSSNEDIADHIMIGKRIYGLDKEKEYTVISAKKQWYNGYYETILIEDKNESSRFVIWKNINCHDEQILKHIDEARENFLIIDSNGNYLKST